MTALLLGYAAFSLAKIGVEVCARSQSAKSPLHLALQLLLLRLRMNDAETFDLNTYMQVAAHAAVVVGGVSTP